MVRLDGKGLKTLIGSLEKWERQLAQSDSDDGRSSPFLAYFQRVNQGMFDRAESLGWRPVER